MTEVRAVASCGAWQRDQEFLGVRTMLLSGSKILRKNSSFPSYPRSGTRPVHVLPWGLHPSPRCLNNCSHLSSQCFDTNLTVEIRHLLRGISLENWNELFRETLRCRFLLCLPDSPRSRLCWRHCAMHRHGPCEVHQVTWQRRHMSMVVSASWTWES